MSSILSLWLPILVAAALVWLASAMIWIVLPWHKKEWSGIPDEENARAGLKGLAPGGYVLPHCTDSRQLQDPDMRRKMEEGPQAFIYVAPNGLPVMAGKLIRSFLFNVLVAVLCAYLLTRTAATAGDYLHVFRVAGTVAFISYSMAYIQESIWFARPWRMTATAFLDAMIYALLTGGVFGWLAT